MFDVFYAWDTDTVFDPCTKACNGPPEAGATVRASRACRSCSPAATSGVAWMRRLRGRRPRAAALAARGGGDAGGAAPVDLLRLALPA